jgi:hypothetical protein
MEYTMVEPAPWDLPPVAAPEPKRKRRGPAKDRSAPAKARRWRPTYEPRETFRLDDCPKCGYLVLETPTIWGPTLVDIWEVPYADACVLERYSHENGDILWFAKGNRLHSWSPMMNCSALRTHHCRNKWWTKGPYIGFVNSYVKDDVYL